jgi:hypothetical protein
MLTSVGEPIRKERRIRRERNIWKTKAKVG